MGAASGCIRYRTTKNAVGMAGAGRKRQFPAACYHPKVTEVSLHHTGTAAHLVQQPVEAVLVTAAAAAQQLVSCAETATIEVPQHCLSSTHQFTIYRDFEPTSISTSRQHTECVLPLALQPCTCSWHVPTAALICLQPH